MAQDSAGVPAPHLVEIGAGDQGNHFWGSLSQEETPELHWPECNRIFHLMRSQDAQVTSVLRAVKLPVRRTTWRVDGRGCRDEVTQFVATDLGLPIVGHNEGPAPQRTKGRFSWQEHLSQALLCLYYGMMPFEQIYRVEETSAGLRYRLRKLAPRHPRSLTRITVARDGGLVSITQSPWNSLNGVARPMINGPVVIPVENLVVYVNEPEAGDWVGSSVLRPAYKNWRLKDMTMKVGAQHIERNAMGIPTYIAAPGETDLNPGRLMAQSVRASSNAGVAIPNGAQMHFLGVEGKLIDPELMLRYHDEQIARAVLAHFLNLGTQTGSWALGSTFSDFFMQGLQTIAQTICDTANQHVVEDLVDLNFGPEEPAPRVIFDEIGQQQNLIITMLKLLTDSGVVIPDRALEEEMRRQVGLPPKDLPSPTYTPNPAPGGTP